MTFKMSFFFPFSKRSWTQPFIERKAGRLKHFLGFVIESGQIRILFTTASSLVSSSEQKECCLLWCAASAPAFLRVKRAGMGILHPLRKCEVCCILQFSTTTSHEVENYGTSYPINSPRMLGPEPMGNQHLPRFLESVTSAEFSWLFQERNYHSFSLL